MRLRHYGNACFSLFHDDLHFLFDPWIGGVTVGGGWTQFPPGNTKVEDLPKIDYVYISHIHSDHCEIETLKKLDRNIPILLMEREPNFLKKYLTGLGFRNLILIPKEKKTEIAGRFHVELFGESFGHLCNNIIDSSLLIQFKDSVVVNCNDNKPSPELCKYIKQHYQNIDLALIPAGGGSGYPAMYENYNFQQKIEISQKIVDNYAKIFTSALDILKPKVAVPVAGGFAIRGLHNPEVNWVQCRRLDQQEVVQYYKEHSEIKNSETKILPMQPGMELDATTASYTQGKYKTWSKPELDAHFKKLSEDKVEPLVHTQEPVRNLGKLISLARNELWFRQEKNGMKPDYRIYFDIPSHPHMVEIDLLKNSSREFPREQKENMRPPYLRMRLDQDTMLEWLMGLEDYNMLDSGHRISFWREPIGQYVQEAYYLMSLLRLA